MSVTSACVKFIQELRAEELPAEAVEAARWAILDGTGVMFPGAATETAAIVADYLEFIGGKPQARIVGMNRAASLPGAALANGTLAHALDFDDVGGFGHPTAVLMPVVYTLADAVKPTGRDALLAYVIGFEVGTCLAARNLFGSIDSKSHFLGWHPTGPYGAVAAAATAARLLDLTRDQTAAALGIAASEACGLLKNFGTMAKPLHAGLAAQNGITAALLASRGFTADEDALGGDIGFLRAFRGPGSYTEEAVSAQLGVNFALVRGVALKRIPACWTSHRAVTGMVKLMQEHRPSPGEIEAIEVDLRPVPLLRGFPETGLEGKFSMRFNLALAVLKGVSEIPDYSRERTQEPEIQAMMSRVRHVPDEPGGNVKVAILLRDGRRLATDVVHAFGDPTLGLDKPAVLDKFRKCAAYRLAPEAIPWVESYLLNLEQQTNLVELMDVMAPISGALV